jgi:hypothetical protein
MKLFISESYCLDYQSDYSSIVVGTVQWTPSATHWQFECQQNDQCKFFTFNSFGGQCFLKIGKSRSYLANGISGPKFCGPVQSEYSQYSKITVHVLCLSNSVFDWGLNFTKLLSCQMELFKNASLIKIVNYAWGDLGSEWR